MQPVLAKCRPWAGPALLLLGAAAVVVLTAVPGVGQGKLEWWLASRALTPERLLPLVGLGVGLALAGPRLWIAGLAVFAAGIAAGFAAKDQLLSLLAMIPDAPIHSYRIGPIGSIAAGLALAPGAKLRPWLLPVAALVVGAALALAIDRTDPTVHDPTIRWTGALLGLWVTAGIGLTGRAFRRPWVTVAGRILGSWLIAIGALYGGASLAPRPEPETEPAESEQRTGPVPLPVPAFPDIDHPPADPLPGMPDRRDMP